MRILKATKINLKEIMHIDCHIPLENLRKCVEDGRVYIMLDKKDIVGLLRFGYLFDTYPFLNLIILKDEYRKRGLGTLLMDKWENDMLHMGYRDVYTSTQADEEAQHFYRKRSYMDIGSFIPYGQHVTELILHKRLQND
jgi:ribosomal protein S18 acetylase RimI-like enzyme